MIGKTFAHYVAVAIGSELPQTQTTEAERALLMQHLPGRKRIVEIGVFEGFTTRVLAEASDPDGTIYGVDPFFTGRLGISWGFMIAKSYNRKYLASGKLKFVRSFSTGVGDKVPETVDFIFIDADHSLAGITADWTFWSERIESGGIIALHDTLLTPDRLQSAEFGSHQYFRSHIQHDSRFRIVGKAGSLSILSRR
ncbi:MAG: class I SAM-dependent methyltransferase [Sulfuricellaceae bacterium]|nr:class I SAM-dependent methyltransferase [Sulfuricellaceae bacterium]